MRRLLSLLFASMIVAGCAGGTTTDGSNLPTSPVVVSPYIQGLSAIELAAYLQWWRSADITQPSDGWQGAVLDAASASSGLATTEVRPPLDPACPLRYDYEQMGATLFENGDGLQLREVNGERGFYNVSRSEALFVLRGISVQAGGVCDYAKGPFGWVIARVSLIDGEERWIIDGLASPAATLTIAVDPGNQMFQVNSNLVEIENAGVAGYSPFRLRRFAINDSNRDRVFAFAQMSQGSNTVGRRLFWFRASDIAGAYAESDCPVIAAFWGSGHGCADAPNLVSTGSDGETTNVWLDEMARQGEVVNRNEDDTFCLVSGGACLQLSNEVWGSIGTTLKKLALLSGDAVADRPASSAQMKEFARLLGGAGGAKADTCSGMINVSEPTGAIDTERVGSVGGLRALAVGGVDGVRVEPDGRDLVVRWRPVAGASGYELRSQVKGSTSWRTGSAPASASSATIRGLIYGKSYFVEVRALPDGAWSAPVEATIGSAIPDGGGGSITPTGNCSYKLDWGLPGTRLPDELIHHTENGVAVPYADVFGIVAAGGRRAWEDTRDRMKESTALAELVGYFAKTDRITGDSVTLSPSFRFMGGEDPGWYKRFSYLFGEAASRGPASMTFSTASSGQKTLRYDPSPASQIRITVTDTLNPNTKVTYKSEWIPTQAIGDFDSPLLAGGECGTFEFTCHISRAVSGFTMSIYQATFGQMVEGLSKGTVGNLLGVPILQRYEIDTVRNIAGGQQVLYRLNEERLRGDPDPTQQGEAGESLCLSLLQAGQLNRFEPPASATRVEVAGSEACYQESGTWGLFNAARGIMVILLVIFTARYVISLMLGRDRQMTIMAFTARAFISLFLIVYVGDVLRFLGTIVAEVIVITNSIGSQVSGKPYSHLWMFSAYLNSPPAGANPFALILMAPFTILGLLVVAIVGWVRLVFAGLVVAMSPIWIVNLLSARQPNFFYTSLLLLLRLYVIPIMALILMLAIFLLLGANDSFFGNADDVTSIPRAVIGALILIVVAIAPVFMAKFTIERIGRPVAQSIQAALAAADDDRAEKFINSTGRHKDSPEYPYGDPNQIRTEGTLAAGASGYALGANGAAEMSPYETSPTTPIGSAPSGGSEGGTSSSVGGGDPLNSFSDGRLGSDELATSHRAQLSGVSTEQLLASEAEQSGLSAVEERAKRYLDRGYDEKTAMAQAERDLNGESISGKWSNRAFSLGASGTKGVLGAMLGGSGVIGEAKASLPGWAQSAIAVGEKHGGRLAGWSAEKGREVADKAGAALARHQTSVRKAEEVRRDWIGAEGALKISEGRLAEAQRSGDPLRIQAATAELKEAKMKAASAYRRVDETQRTFSGRMSKIGVPVIGTGLRLRDGATSDARAVKRHLEKLERDLGKERAARMVSESGTRRNPGAVAKIDQRIAELERRRNEVAARISVYDSRGEIAGRRRQSAVDRHANRASHAAARARRIDEVLRNSGSASIAVREALVIQRAEAMRAAAAAAGRAGLRRDQAAYRTSSAISEGVDRTGIAIDRLDEKANRKISDIAKRIGKDPTAY